MEKERDFRKSWHNCADIGGHAEERWREEVLDEIDRLKKENMKLRDDGVKVMSINTALEKERDQLHERIRVLVEQRDRLEVEWDSRFTLDEIKVAFKIWLCDGEEEYSCWDTGDEESWNEVEKYLLKSREKPTDKCPDCDGTGYGFDYDAGGNKIVDRDDICETCGGTGEIPKKKELK